MGNFSGKRKVRAKGSGINRNRTGGRQEGGPDPGQGLTEEAGGRIVPVSGRCRSGGFQERGAVACGNSRTELTCGGCGLYLVAEVQKLTRQKSQVQDQGKQRRKRLPPQPRPRQPPPHKPTRMEKPGKCWSTKTTVFNDTLRVHFVKQSSPARHKERARFEPAFIPRRLRPLFPFSRHPAMPEGRHYSHVPSRPSADEAPWSGRWIPPGR